MHVNWMQSQHAKRNLPLIALFPLISDEIIYIYNKHIWLK